MRSNILPSCLPQEQQACLQSLDDDDKMLQDYVTWRMVRKQEELTKEMIYECFNMDLKVKGLERYVMNTLFKDVR